MGSVEVSDNSLVLGATEEKTTRGRSTSVARIMLGGRR